MITINNPNYRFIYDLLTRELTEKNHSVEGEEWKKENKRENQNRILQFGPIELITPLDYLTQTFIKRFNSFFSIVNIHSRSKDVFKGLSVPYQQEIAEKGYVFYPSSSDLTGFIFLKEREKSPLAVIISNEENSCRSLGLGFFGAKPLKLGSYEDFAIENGRLTTITNLFLSTVYSKFIPKELMEKLERIVLYLN